MPRKKRNELICDFALVDVQGNGRKAFAECIRAGHRVRFVMSGYIIGPGGVGRDDGTSIEFAAEVDKLDLAKPEYVSRDRFGRPWALLSEVKAGTKLELDDGFTCSHRKVRGRRIVTVKLDRKRTMLYWDCKEGKHYIETASLGKHGELVGCYLV